MQTTNASFTSVLDHKEYGQLCYNTYVLRGEYGRKLYTDDAAVSCSQKRI